MRLPDYVWIAIGTRMEGDYHRPKWFLGIPLRRFWDVGRWRIANDAPMPKRLAWGDQ